MTKKRRNHKEALRRRSQRLRTPRKKQTFEEYLDACVDEYNVGLDVEIVPFISEALSIRMTHDIPNKIEARSNLLNALVEQISRATKDIDDLPNNIPSKVLSSEAVQNLLMRTETNARMTI